MTDPIDVSPGVLTKSQIKYLFDKDSIINLNFPKPNIEDMDASAFDITLSTDVWEIEEGQRPATRELEKLKAKSREIQIKHDSDGDYFLLQKRKIYLIKLDSYLKLPSNINGRATGKSSIGRLDVITRLLTEPCIEYDVVQPDYEGQLYLLVLPQTFPIIVRPGRSLNQLRLFSGPPHASVITRDLIDDFGVPFWHVAHESWEDSRKRFKVSRISDPTLFDLTVDLADPDYRYIFKAKAGNHQPIDCSKIKHYSPDEFFEKTAIEGQGNASSVTLEQGSFYIMKSKERLALPCDVAVEIAAISERIGDIRIHYAGFAHPYFGQYENGSKKGTPLIFEVRATDMDTRLYDRSLLARVQFFRMSKEAEAEKDESEYNRQELQLSKVFAEWPGD